MNKNYIEELERLEEELRDNLSKQKEIFRKMNENFRLQEKIVGAMNIIKQKIQDTA